jgi:PleD family two-component response regulator
VNERRRTPLSLIMLDVDHFKRINILARFTRGGGRGLLPDTSNAGILAERLYEAKTQGRNRIVLKQRA